MAQNKIQVPVELKGKLPRMIVEMAWRSVLIILLSVTALPFLFIQLRYHELWTYFIPAFGGPLLTALFLLIRPFNPYQSYYARLEEIDRDFFPKGSPEAKLVRMLRSTPAKWLVIKSCAGASGMLLILVSIIASLKPSPVDISFKVWNIIFLVLMYALSTFGVCCHVLLRSAFKNWTRSA